MTTTAPALPPVPALVPGTVGHVRHTQMERSFDHPVYQWLVDVDELPRMSRWLRPFSTFRAADHLGDPNRSLRANVEDFCRTGGVDVTGDRILMLANARVLGHVFDPLTVFWCLDRSGEVHAVVAEVHNTYGQRHAYLLDTDAQGRAGTAKEFYVSPFLSVAGDYVLRFTLDASCVGTTITLRQDDADVFRATFQGTPVPATPARLSRLLLAKPLMTWRVSLLIRLHGLRLWAKGLPIVPRPRHHHQEGVS